MTRWPPAHLTIRASVFLGFAITAGVWVVTGYEFTRRMAEVERESAAVTARYMRAQDLLATIRAQVLVSSVQLRDALLDPSPSGNGPYEERLRRTYTNIDAALAGYVPVLDTASEREQFARLRDEIRGFRETTFDVLRADDGTANIRDLLNQRIVPRREAAVRVSEEVQALNRTAYVQQQTITTAIHRGAESQVWRRLGLSLLVSVGVSLLAALYAGRLEDRLKAQGAKEAETARELQRLSTRLINAQEDERRTIARELHDEVGQVLTALKVELSVADRAATGAGARGLLEEAQSIADGALRTVRDLSQLLHPSVLDDMGLPAAVDWYLRTVARRHSLAVRLSTDGITARLAPEIEVAAYRIVQEAVANVVRHAAASHCAVALAQTGARLRITVNDDGRGFDVQAPGASGVPRGLGLVGIRERASQFGGTLRLTSVPEQGTTLEVELACVDPGGVIASGDRVAAGSSGIANAHA